MGRFGTIDGILEPSPAGVEEFQPPSCVAWGHTPRWAALARLRQGRERSGLWFSLASGGRGAVSTVPGNSVAWDAPSREWSHLLLFIFRCFLLPREPPASAVPPRAPARPSPRFPGRRVSPGSPRCRRPARRTITVNNAPLSTQPKRKRLQCFLISVPHQSASLPGRGQRRTGRMRGTGRAAPGRCRRRRTPGGEGNRQVRDEGARAAGVTRASRAGKRPR